MTANSPAIPENRPEILIDRTRTNKDSQCAVHSTVGKREQELDEAMSKASEPVAKSRERARGLNLDFADTR
jgi:hypothetical protein